MIFSQAIGPLLYESVRELELNKTGFEIETEISVECVLKGQRVEEIPVTYLPRSEKGLTKLNPLKDGFKIGSTIYKLAKVHNPMFYFGDHRFIIHSGRPIYRSFCY